MISSLLGIARRYIILFGLVKFCAGLVIGFGLGVYFLPILTAEKGLSDSELTALSAATSPAGLGRDIHARPSCIRRVSLG